MSTGTVNAADLVAVVEKWRGKLRELGGMDNAMVAVYAGGVRAMLDDFEALIAPRVEPPAADLTAAIGERAGLARAWDVVNAMIKPGPLGGNGCDDTAQRNGLILAANAIAASWASADAAPDAETKAALEVAFCWGQYRWSTETEQAIEALCAALAGKAPAAQPAKQGEGPR